MGNVRFLPFAASSNEPKTTKCPKWCGLLAWALAGAVVAQVGWWAVEVSRASAGSALPVATCWEWKDDLKPLVDKERTYLGKTVFLTRDYLDMDSRRAIELGERVDAACSKQRLTAEERVAAEDAFRVLKGARR